jgi:hypothetical protein
VSNTGETYDFGISGSTVFDMDIGGGISVDISTSQGFSQMGESVEGQTTVGRIINVKGVIYKDISRLKKKLRNVFSPFTSGRLTFENGYYIDVYVKDTPTFLPKKDDGRFTMLLYAPFPFFSKSDNEMVELGETVPLFSFPVNYAEEHIFGHRNTETDATIVNDGNVDVGFNVVFSTIGVVSNISVTNLDTEEFLKVKGDLYAGWKIILDRNAEGVLTATMTDGIEKINIIDQVDENSTLFKIRKGVNRFRIRDDFSNGKMLNADFIYSEAVTSIYED